MSGAGQQQQQWGVTPPISVSEPTARDVEVTRTLVEELRGRGVYPTPDDNRSREIVLGRLSTLAKEFVYRSSLNHGLSEQKAREAGGTIFTFGSYRLGVSGPGADIDTLLVVPKHVEREEFHTLFEQMLKELDDVAEVTSVPEAFVPIIKCTVSGIDIDLLFARMNLASVPDDLDLSDDTLLRNLDEKCVRSINGSRVTDAILRLVPDVAVFRESLRTIKLWAKKRAIYGNVMGFPGGVAWAMLVARICQLYPKQCAGGIISRFFIILSQWQWPQPVLLCPIVEGPLQVRVWNPKLYPSDRSHRMPIITPAYPSMCSTHNVTLSTQSIVTAELKRASEIVDKVMVGNRPWSDLFQSHDFFSKYRYYLQITASSSDAEMQLKWSGTVESKIRQLVMKLEFVETLLLAHPFIKGFDKVFYCKTDEERKAVATGDVPAGIEERTAADLVEGQGGTMHATTFYIGLMIERKPASGPRKLDISYPTTEFTKLVKMWDSFDPDMMGIVVRYIKSSGLPSYVHEGAAPEPAKVGGVKRDQSGKTASEQQAAPQTPTQEKDMLGEPGRSNKKLRSSSFVPESAGPVQASNGDGEMSASTQASTLAAANLVTNGTTDVQPATKAPSVPAAGTANGSEATNGLAAPQQQTVATT